MTEIPFDKNDNLSTKHQKLEKRIRMWMDKKYDLVGISQDPIIREKLFDYDMSIFLNMFLWRTISYHDFSENLTNETKKEFSKHFQQKEKTNDE